MSDAGAVRKLPWRDVTRANVANLPSVEQRRTMTTSFYVSVIEDLHRACLDAAHARGLSLTSYARRALLAFVAYDTDQSVRDLVAIDARIRRPGSRAVMDPEMRLGGPWEIVGLEPNP